VARRLPPLKALADFEAAARHLSFTKAAAELNLTHGAVSRQVKTLEDHLGVPLFRRGTRALHLTDQGRLFAATVRETLDQLARATESLRIDERANRLSVSTTYSFAINWLVPRLARFRELHPDIDVRVQADDRYVDFARDEVDVAIRYGSGAFPGLETDHLFTDEYVPVCSPALLKGKRPLRVPADLRHHPFIHEEHVPFDWPDWLAAAGVANVDATRGPIFSHSSMVIQAAINGEGVALGNAAFIGEALAARRLVKPFDITLKSTVACFAAYPPGTLARRKVKVFRDWLLAEVERSRAPASDAAKTARRTVRTSPR
jgi:LysR family glycine cleavage system transcriptional activator